MRQILQNVNSGDLTISTVPPPAVSSNSVQVRTAASLISAGTEKMLIQLAQKSLLGKAQARPDLVKQVIGKAKKEGILNTYRNVRTKMEKPMPLGYSAAGTIISVGGLISGLRVGDRVAIAGAGYACHAEVNVVPRNLVARIPDSVSFEEAAYTTVASIALQGVRLAAPQLGDYSVVIGLGLIGLITVQLLKASGCQVLGIDLNTSRLEHGCRLGLDEAVSLSSGDVQDAVEQFSRGRGVDHTIITAATDSNKPVIQAGQITRRKGRVVVVGAVGLDIPRDVYYKKELDIQFSMSYGPGRYDPSYEEGGIDYPYDYVRWTEQRNMEAVLSLVAQKRLDVKSLTTHTFKFENALKGYDLIRNGAEPFVGITLTYDDSSPVQEVVRLNESSDLPTKNILRLGFIGAGNYASLHLLPHLAQNRSVCLEGLVTATGLSSKGTAEKFGFTYCTTEAERIFDDDSLDAVFIATRHSTHAELAIRALEAGKHVFVEKPMVVTEAQLDAVCTAYRASVGLGFMVGLNRRFSPMVQKLKEVFQTSSTLQMIYRVNSGPIPLSSWIYEQAEGGGMLVGEMCHFIDLMQHISEEKPARVFAQSLATNRTDLSDSDNIIIVISFENGSTGTLCYNTIGSRSFSKERLEVYGSGSVAVLEDFRRLEITRGGTTTRKKSLNQDKGQKQQLNQTVESFRLYHSGPVPFEQFVSGMRVVFGAQRSLMTGDVVDIL